MDRSNVPKWSGLCWHKLRNFSQRRQGLGWGSTRWFLKLDLAKSVPIFQTWWDPIQKLSCKMSRMTCLSFVFSSKPPRRTSLQINSEMTWLSFSFHYKRLNLYFTIKLVFEIRTSHYIHALAFHAKRPTSQVTLPPVVQACWQRTEVGWQYGQIRINILTAKVLSSNINVPVFILMKIS